MSRLLIRLLVWFLLLLAAGALAHFMVRHPGYVMIAWGQWMLEVTLWAALGTLVVIVLLGWLLVWALKVSNPLRWVRRYRSHRDQKVARQETAHAVTAWLQGNDDEAEAALIRVAKAGGSERLPWLLSLVAARERSDWLEKAQQWRQQDPELAWVADALHAEQLAQAGDTDGFLAWLDQHPKLVEVRGLRKQYWQALFEAGESERLLQAVQGASGLSPEDRVRWQTRAALQWLRSDADSAIVERIKRIPKALRSEPAVIAEEVQGLHRQGDVEVAFKRLKKALDQRTDDALVELLATLAFDTQAALTLAEHLEKKTDAPSASLCWTLGQLCEREALWGKAEDYLTAAWQQAPSPRIGLALAAHFEHRDQPQKAQPIYKTLASQGGSISDG
jgi:heme biosynthesis-associated TPR repeat protein